MNMKSTATAAAQANAHVPMQRIDQHLNAGGGQRGSAEILASVKRNANLCANFGGGQVDIHSGKYVVSSAPRYKIEQRQDRPQPLKGAMLIGQRPEEWHRITRIRQTNAA